MVDTDFQQSDTSTELEGLMSRVGAGQRGSVTTAASGSDRRVTRRTLQAALRRLRQTDTDSTRKTVRHDAAAGRAATKPAYHQVPSCIENYDLRL